MNYSMNIELAEKVIFELAKKGIYSFCLCPGGRLAPFVEVLSHSKGLEVLSFFEERSAGFFALGRTERDQRPAAVLTTSGTAVAELLPSVVESYYSAWPLVLITSDRPLEAGKKGSPQTLKNNVQILEDYCQISKNIVELKDVDLSDWHPSKGSLHLNVCFDEPFDKEINPLDFFDFNTPALSIYPSEELFYSENEKHHLKAGSAKVSSADHSAHNSSLPQNLEEELEKFFHTCKKPLLLVGELKLMEKPAVKDILTHYRGLFYTEPLSGLEAWPQRLVSGEKILNYALEKKEIDGVIRLGGIPRIRFWRDLEKRNIPVLNFSSPPFYAGLARFSFNQPLLGRLDLLKSYLVSLKDFGDNIKAFDKIQMEKWKSILEAYPQSEEFWFWTLKKSLKDNTKVFLGNSSPIRLWDMMAFEKKKNLFITGQAGVNGIDGLVSRFLGGCESQKNNVGIVGDLSLLYDMAGFWRAKEAPPWTLIVINNFGGQIFSRLFKNSAFLNRHQISFSSLAEMWGLNYELYSQPAHFNWPEKPYSLVEIRPKAENSKASFKKYASIWDSL